MAQIDAEQQRVVDSLQLLIDDPASHDTTVMFGLLRQMNFFYMQQPDSAIKICKKALVLAEKHDVAKAKSNCYGWLGYLYEDLGDIELALKYSYKGLKLFEELDDKKSVGISLNNIGFMHYNQKDYEKAFECFEKSLKLKEERNDSLGIAMSWNNLAFIYEANKDSEKQLECFNKSLAIYRALDDKQGLGLMLGNIGSVYGDLEDYKTAHEYHMQSLAYNEEIDYKQGMAISTYNIGRGYFKQGQIAAAKPYAERSLALSQETGFPTDIKDAALLLSDIYKAQNQGMKALEMHQLYVTMRDSIQNEETQATALKQQTQYEYEKQKAIDDAEHEKQIAIKQEEKEKQQVLTTAIAIGLLLVVVFLIFVFNRLRVTRKQKAIIEEQRDEVEEARAQLEEKNQEVRDSITYAKRIQNAILPSEKLIKNHLKDAFVLYKPKDVVAGDFYWVEQKGDGILFAAADCTGHGVPGAMMSVVCHNALNRAVREYDLNDPADILNKTREIVMQEFEKSEEDVRDGMDIALCHMDGKDLLYAGAHNPLWVVRNGEMIEIKGNKQPVGKFRGAQEFVSHQVELEKGDIIYLFSDGYADQFGGEKGKKLKTRAFRDLLLSLQGLSMEEQKEKINQTFEDWRGNLEQIDDVCIIGVRI